MICFTRVFPGQIRATILSIGFMVMLFVSCASSSKAPTEFEQFSVSFLQEVDNAEQNIEKYSELVKELSGYENRLGDLSDIDYTNINETLSNASGAKKEMDLQIQKAKDIGRSVTADGRYTNTKKKVRGWNNDAYTNMSVEIKLSALDRAKRAAEEIYGSIDLNLLKRPNKPFNAKATSLIKQANFEVASAKSDVAAKDWTSGKSATNRANNAIKNALSLDLNDIEQYQINWIQDELKKVSSDISLGSTLNTAGSIIEDAARGATGILGGIGDILKGVGKKINK